MTRLSLFLLFLLPLCSLAQNREISFTAEADAKQVILGGYFEVSFTLKNVDGSNLKTPDFKGFKVLSGPNQSTSVTSFNGAWSKSIAYSYVLQPKKVGRFTIGSASIRADGKVLKTKPIKIEVLKGNNSNATTQKDLDKQIEKDIFIKAEANLEEAKIGEQIILDYKLYTTRDIETYNIMSESDYPGFYAQDIRRFNSRVVKEVIDGVQYSTKILKRVALFPQQAGLLKVDPMVMQLSIITDSPKNRKRRGFFYTPNVTRLQVSTEPYQVDIFPLPDNAPASFTGAIGNYKMVSTASQTNLSTDDAITLKMAISGTGDIKRIQPPKLRLSDSLEIYDPRVIEEQSFEEGGKITGKKVMEYLILPQKPGTYKITPEFSYYNPDSLKYIVLNSKSYTFQVRKGTQSKRLTKTLVQESGPTGEIRHIKSTTQLYQKGSSFFGSPLYLILMGLPALFLTGLVWYRYQLNQKGEVNHILLKRNRAEKVARQRLAQAEHFLKENNSKSFYDEISRGLFGYVCDKLNIPLSELTKQNVQEKLVSLKVTPTLIEKFMSMIKTCEMALFAGKDNLEAMGETYQSALDTVVKIEEEIGK